MTRRWSEVRRTRLSDEQLDAIDARVERRVLELSLQELRKHRNLTQAQLAELLEVSQPELSRIENSSNPLLSTVRRVVEALGGEIEVTAKFDDGVVKLSGM